MLGRCLTAKSTYCLIFQGARVQFPAPILDGSQPLITHPVPEIPDTSGLQRHLHSHAHAPTQITHTYVIKKYNNLHKCKIATVE